ncbi:MAG: dTMP kinase [FCB group bacterium]|nr:dTMP kinase [FCB group bacterium]
MKRLITFEGIDGSGKSTQIRLVCKRFDALGLQYTAVREPGGTRISEKIREILLQKENLELTAAAESLLFQAARAQLTAEVILPALREGKFVICDRFTDSSLAYQGFGRGLDLNTLETLNNYATQDTQPDLTFIIDIKVATAISRRSIKVTDRMESGGDAFMERIRRGYIELARGNPGRYRLMNGNLKERELFQQIWNILQEKYVGVL